MRRCSRTEYNLNFPFFRIKPICNFVRADRSSSYSYITVKFSVITVGYQSPRNMSSGQRVRKFRILSVTFNPHRNAPVAKRLGKKAKCNATMRKRMGVVQNRAYTVVLMYACRRFRYFVRRTLRQNRLVKSGSLLPFFFALAFFVFDFFTYVQKFRQTHVFKVDSV